MVIDTKENIKAILIQIEIEESNALFIVLAKDGSIHRRGTGTVDNTERDMYIGITKEPLFTELCAKIDDGWLESGGVYDLKEKKGKNCKLTIMFQDERDENVGLEFQYGSESEGPPSDITEFVISAVSLTEPWYSKQKDIANKT